MNYDIEKVIFNINNNYLTMNNQKFKILNILGKGSVGTVHLIEQNNKLYIIKISNKDCYENLIDEIKVISNIFKKHKLVHTSYPLYYGNIINMKTYGIIYPYLGFYNLKSIKKTSYKINNKQKILIIRQIIEQMKLLKNTIHSDINSSNIVINIKLDKIIATIIDFGLIKEETEEIFSVSYITSPESLLTLDNFKDCLSNDINYLKHDYFGLFSIIIDLFSNKSMWKNFSYYFINIINIPIKYFDSEKVVYYFVYCWYKFYYDSIDNLPNESFKKLITKIEKIIINIDKFVSFDIFFDNIILDGLHIKDFMKKLIHFNPNERPSLDDLLNHDFLN